MENCPINIRYYSGYIRNFKNLCKELGLSEGMSRVQREEEILKAAYLKWGADMPAHLCGAFAFAIEDHEKKTLFVARDQVGQKQMFYTVAGEDLICSGDIDAIANDSRVEKKLNLRMLQQYLFYGYPIGEETFYENICKLRPGHSLLWNGEEIRIQRYFAPTFAPDRSKSIDEYAENLRRVVNEILDEERQDKELPYKESFLSGGVDSSYLLAAGDAQAANTVGYEDSGFDESELARETAKTLNKNFNVKQISPEEYFERIPTVIDKMGQPLGDASAVAFSLGCQAAKEHTDIVYSGEGIDEFFGGYNAHRRHLPDDWIYLSCSHIMSEEVVRSLMKDFNDKVKAADPILPLWEEAKDFEELDQKLYIDISLWLEGDIYLNTDRTSTACGIELHTPFSDVRLFEAARVIPPEYLFCEEQNKYVFRKAASEKLPAEVAFRKKVGFPVPVRKWLSDSRYNSRVKEKLFGKTAERFFRMDELASMWNRFIEGEDLLWNRIYAIYVFILWYELKF